MSRDASKQETREAILDAAERLLERYGYSKMTMTDLAEEAGIGVGTTYLYFPGKVDVALAVLERIHNGVLVHLQQIADTAEDAPERLRRMLIARIRLRYERVRNQRHLTEEFKHAIQPLINEHRARWQAAEAEIFAGVLSDGVREGAFACGTASETAEMLMRATSCLLPRNLTAEDLSNPAAFLERLNQLIDFLLRALRPCVAAGSDLLASVV